MPDLDLYPCASLREALGVWQAATRADPEAPGLTELAVLAGYAPSTLYNALHGRRALRARLSLGRAMGLSLGDSAHLSLLGRLDGASAQASARIQERVAAARAARPELARGALGALDTAGLRAALPVLCFGRPSAGPRALAGELWPAVSMLRAARALHADQPPAPAITLDAQAIDLHQIALRRLSHALFQIPLEARRLRLSLYPAHPRAVAAAAALLDRRLDELVERYTADEGPRLTLHLGARLIPVAQLPPALDHLTPAWRPTVTPASAAPPPRGPRVMSYDRAGPFLYDAVRHRKAEHPHRSYTTLGRRVGLAASTLAGATRDGRINLAAAERVGAELGLCGDELRYFSLLVEQEVSDCPATRSYARDEMAELRARHGLLSLDRDGGWTEASWTALVLRELAGCPGFRPEPAVLATALSPEATPAEVRATLDRLAGLGLLVPDGSGTLRPANRFVSMPEHTLQDAHLLRLLHATDVAEHALARGAGWWSARLLSAPQRGLRALLNDIVDLQREVANCLAKAEQIWPADGVTMLLLDATPWSRARPR